MNTRTFRSRAIELSLFAFAPRLQVALRQRLLYASQKPPTPSEEGLL